MQGDGLARAIGGGHQGFVLRQHEDGLIAEEMHGDDGPVGDQPDASGW